MIYLCNGKARTERWGVEAARAQTLENLADLLAVSNRRKGPFLIELVIP
jgi:hypothetical protein